MDITLTIKRLASWPRELSSKRGIKRGNVDYAKTRGKLVDLLRELGATSASLGVSVDSVSDTGWPNAGHRPLFPGVCLVVDSPFGELLFCCDKFSLWTHNLRAIVDTLEGLHRMVGLGTIQPQQMYAAFQWVGLTDWLASGAFIGDLGRPFIATSRPGATASSKKASAPTGSKAKARTAPTSGSPRPSAPPPPRTPPPRTSRRETFETRGQAAEWLAEQTGVPRSQILRTENVFLNAYRKAARTLHPDVGGDAAQFRLLQNAKTIIERGAAWTKVSG